MTEEEEVDYLWGLALTKDSKGKWRHSDFPVAKDAKPRLETRWIQAKKKTQDITGKPITVELVEQYWYAEARDRRSQKDYGQRPAIPVGISKWIYEERWNNGIEPSETEPKKSLRKCKCGQPTHGPNYSECQTCMSFENGKLKGWAADMMREYFKTHNIDHTKLKGLSQGQQYRVIKQLLAGNKNILLDK